VIFICDLGIDGKEIKMYLGEIGMRVWICFIWRRIGTGGGLL
jgi:hypothetical protein